MGKLSFHGADGDRAAVRADRKHRADRTGVAPRVQKAYDCHARLAFLCVRGSTRRGLSTPVKTYRLTEQFQIVFDSAVRLARSTETDALLLLVETPFDWDRLVDRVGDRRLLVAADFAAQLEGAAEAGLATVVLNMPEAGVYEKLTQALLESVADDLLAAGAQVVALYSGFEAGTIDSISLVHLGEHLGQLTARDLRQLETRVPLDTLKTVVDIAVEIGREGREGKPVGTLFVVGDHREVTKYYAPGRINPFRGYSEKARNILDDSMDEVVKEIAKLDGAFIVKGNGVIVAAGVTLRAAVSAEPMPQGLGARHAAAGSITACTRSIAVTLSESTGDVRVWRRGALITEIEKSPQAIIGGAPPSGLG